MIQTSGYLEQTDYQSQLDTHLAETIDELREKSEQEIEDYKTSVENANKDKVSLLTSVHVATAFHALHVCNTVDVQMYTYKGLAIQWLKKMF